MVSGATNTNTIRSGADETPQNSNASPLPLPGPGEGTSDSAVHKLDLSSGSGTVKLDHLGPLVVNADGSLGRIANWAQMTEAEQRNTLRVLGKRNRERLAALKEQMPDSQGESITKEGEGQGKDEL